MSASESPSYTVRLRNRRVRRELDALREPDHRRVLAAMRGLAIQPRPVGCEKLYDDVHRIRVSDRRIIYLVDDENRRVDVGGIRRRSEGTYKGIDDLFR